MLTTNNNKVMLSDKAYSFGKKLVQVILPAVSSLYFGLAQIWDLPAAEKVVGTIALVTTFIGVSLRVSSSNYDSSGAGINGTLHILPDPEGPTQIVAQLNDLPADKGTVTLQVNAPQPPPVPQG